MRGSDFAKLLPEPLHYKSPSDIATAYAARDAHIVQAVRDGFAAAYWFRVDISTKKFKASVLVCNPLAIGEGANPLIVSMSARGQQAVADLLGASLLTPRIVDLVHKQCVLPAEPLMREWWADGSMGATARMVEQSEALHKRAPQLSQMLVSCLMKDWVLHHRLNTAKPTTAANYGGITIKVTGHKGEPPELFNVAQPVGLAHDDTHCDYSQGVRLMKGLVVDGVATSIEAALADVNLCELFSAGGPILRTRMIALGSVTMPPAPPPKPLTRTLRRGMVGDDVAEWQAILGLGRDGQFGPKTEEATKKFQASRGLTADGIVGPLTRAAALGSSAPPAPAPTKPQSVPPLDVPGRIPFVKAKWFTAVQGPRAIDLVVLHTAEVPERTTSAEAVAAYFKNPQRKNAAGALVDVQASAHYCVDSDSVVQCVADNDVAFAAPGANKNGIQIEMSGYARQSPEDWSDAYSDAMLRRTAALVADLCRRFDIPRQWVDAAGLASGQRGISTHAAASKAFKKSTHTDPGPDFPFERFLAYVRSS